MTSEFQNWIQITVLCCLAIMGFGRAIILKKRKIQVIVLDSQITKSQLINGIFFVTCFLTWIFESIAYGLSLKSRIPLKIFEKLLIHHIGSKIFGIFVLIFGLVIYALALYSFRDSWRVGIDREKPGKLITTGIFRWSRNPIYISLNLLVLGTFLLQGYFIFFILFICIAISLHIQILQEEKFLIQTYGEAYINYCSQAGRYFIL